MGDNDKPFACSADGCNMRFTNEDHLTVHKKKHNMMLNLGNGQKNVFVADQTPTPTRFIRNCEEVGLFQDLQNVNPFEETFRKAVEAVKTGAAPLHEMDSLSVPVGAGDDTLHTPHVFPHIEDSTSNGADSYKSHTTPLISSTSVIMQNGQSKSSDDLSPIEERRELDRLLHTTSTTEDEDEVECTIMSHNVPRLKVVKQEADTSQHCKPNTKPSQNPATKYVLPLDGLHTEPPATAAAPATVQLLLRLPDGKIVQVSNFPVEQMNTTGSNGMLQVTQPEVITQSVPTGTISVTKNIAPAFTVSSTTNTTTPSAVSQATSGISLAKLKLKQTLTSINRTGAASKDSSSSSSSSSSPSSSTVTARKQSESKATAAAAAAAELIKLHEAQPPGQSSSSDRPQRRTSAASSGSGSEDAADKRQRFLERNRAAAMRCREKRKTWIQDLERRAEEMQNVNQHLQAEVASLRAEVAQLKTLLLAHKDCPITQAMAQSGTQAQVINVTLPIPSATPQPSQNQVILIKNSAIAPSVTTKRSGDSLDKRIGSTVKKKCLSAAPILGRALLVPSTEKPQSDTKKTPTVGVLVTNPVVTTTALPLVIPPQQSPASAIFLPRICLSGPDTGQYLIQQHSPEKNTGESETVSNVIRVNPNVVRVPGTECSDDSDIEIITEIPLSNSSSR